MEFRIEVELGGDHLKVGRAAVGSPIDDLIRARLSNTFWR